MGSKDTGQVDTSPQPSEGGAAPASEPAPEGGQATTAPQQTEGGGQDAGQAPEGGQDVPVDALVAERRKRQELEQKYQRAQNTTKLLKQFIQSGGQGKGQQQGQQPQPQSQQQGDDLGPEPDYGTQEWYQWREKVVEKRAAQAAEKRLMSMVQQAQEQQRVQRIKQNMVQLLEEDPDHAQEIFKEVQRLHSGIQQGDFSAVKEMYELKQQVNHLQSDEYKKQVIQEYLESAGKAGTTAGEPTSSPADGATEPTAPSEGLTGEAAWSNARKKFVGG